MGNICSIAISCDAIFSRCLDCTVRNAAYVSDLEDNLAALETELQKLIEARNDVMRRVMIAEQQHMKCTDQVRGWLSRVEAVEAEVGELQEVQPQEIKKLCLGGYCSKNCKSSYEFGKKVAKKLQVVIGLKAEGDFSQDVAERVPKDLVDEIPIEPTIVGQQSTFDEVWGCLQKNQVGIVGLYGIGGVGKTTLLKQINNKFCHEGHDFDIVIWVVVSKELQLWKIQECIAKKIGLFDESWKNKSLEEKAQEIFKILSKKKFVLFLDDIWKWINLTEVGVPLPNPPFKSKMVFTTRFLDVCGAMKAHTLRVECLDDEEAWKLFKKNLQRNIIKMHPGIKELAKMVAKECGGLPLVLVTVGQAMACKKTLEEWNDAIEVLRRSVFEFPGMENIYPRLKFSYDKLPNDIVRSCFLYCSLFHEDCRILKRYLVDCWIGEGFLDEYNDTAINRGYSIIGDLMRACLLEEEGDCVVMHDVIRDVALWIAREIKKENIFVHSGLDLTEAPAIEKWQGAKRISLTNNRIENLLETPTCPHLVTLFLCFNSLSMITSNFFKFMHSLKVLILARNASLKELPLTISKLVSLQHLDISWTRIVRLPEELKALVNLKYLNMDGTRYVSTIPRQLISNFFMLRVLRMWHCGVLEEATEDSVVFDDDFLLEELLGLKHLIMSNITLKSSHALQKFLSSDKFRSCIQSLSLQLFDDSKSLHLSLLTGIKCLHALYLSGEYLENLEIDWVGEVQKLRERNGFQNLSYVEVGNCNRLRDMSWLILAPNIKKIRILHCVEMEEIISVGKLSEAEEMMESLILFAKLEFLILEDLPNLQSIYWGALPFPHLKPITVVKCPKLRILPLDSNSAMENKIIIKAKEDWWKELQWKDEATKMVFEFCLIPF